MPNIQRLIYIANARLPTEKANGYQICKMCEAFSRHVSVLLLYPYRRQAYLPLQRIRFLDYYGLKKPFHSRQLKNLDISSLEKVTPKRFYQILILVQRMIWGFYSVCVARRIKADCYYTRNIQVAYWLAKFKLPTVYEAHTLPRGAQRLLLKALAKMSTLKLVVVLTKFIKQGLVDMGYDEKKIMVLSDGVDISMFDNLPSRDECRIRLGLPSDRTIVGYIGRFQTLGIEKGIAELIQAIKEVDLTYLGRGEPLLLCVGGPMELIPSYLDYAHSLSVPLHRLQFNDRVPNEEVPLWIRACDVVTIPWPWTEFSAYFTSPMKLFEYMAAGVPIVATDLPAIREILTHRESCWLVEPDNPQALAQGITCLLKDEYLCDRLTYHARLLAKKYTWQQRTQEVLNRLSKGAPLTSA